MNDDIKQLTNRFETSGVMNNNFKELNISKPIIKAIELMGFKEPTIVQKEAIPYILNKKDIIVMSKTGSGKTAAFGIPIAQSIDTHVKGIQGLVLSPTRELAVQVNQDLERISKFRGISTTAVYGQHSISNEIASINKGAAIVTGTPGRVLDHISNKRMPTKNIRFLVLDEADRMLDMGFYEQVVEIISNLPRKRVTLLFSATMPPDIIRICKKYMIEPVTLELGSDSKTVDSVKQIYYRVENNKKGAFLYRILKSEKPDSCIIFCNTRKEVDWITKYLWKKGFDIAALHGGNSQHNRMKTISRLKKGTLPILVATDVAARGIHIDELSLVINYDVPLDKNSYIHRIGRTGRVGNSGKAITLVTGDDLWTFYEIEEHVGVRIEESQLPKQQPKPQQQPVYKNEYKQEKKEIDYRQEAKKLMARANIEEKPSFLRRFKNFLMLKKGL